MNEPTVIHRYYFQRRILADGKVFVEAIDNLIDEEVRMTEAQFEHLRKQMMNRITKELYKGGDYGV